MALVDIARKLVLDAIASFGAGVGFFRDSRLLSGMHATVVQGLRAFVRRPVVVPSAHSFADGSPLSYRVTMVELWIACGPGGGAVPFC